MAKLAFMRGRLGRDEHRIMDIRFTWIAPDGEICHGQSHGMIGSQMVHQCVFVDKATAISLEAGETDPDFGARVASRAQGSRVDPILR